METGESSSLDQNQHQRIQTEPLPSTSSHFDEAHGSSSLNISTSKNKQQERSTSAFAQYCYYPGKIVYKKKKAPETPLQNVISSQQFRVSVLNRNNKKKTKKNVWICVYCDIEFSADKKGKSNRKWINCDGCERKMHLDCVPRTHLASINFEEDTESAEVDFMCECCSQN